MDSTVTTTRPARATLHAPARLAAIFALALGAVACGPGGSGDAGTDAVTGDVTPPTDALRDTTSGDTTRVDARPGDAMELDAPPAPDIVVPPMDTRPPDVARDVPATDTASGDGSAGDGSAGDGSAGDAEPPGDAELCPVGPTIPYCDTLEACNPATYTAACVDSNRLRACESSGTVWYYWCPTLGGSCRACRGTECTPGNEFLCGS